MGRKCLRRGRTENKERRTEEMGKIHKQKEQQGREGRKRTLRKG